MEWNELPENIRADYIRKGISLGYRSLEDIQKNFNSFKKGGTTKKPSLRLQFIAKLDKELSKKEYLFFNTPLFRKYFIDLAERESNFKDLTNKIGASGYFQLMPYNRHGNNLFRDMFNLTRRNYLSLQRSLNSNDYANMRKLGVDIYGMLGAMHLGGGNAYTALRSLGKNNAQDMNGTSVMNYMKRFSQGSKEANVLLDDEPLQSVIQTSQITKPEITYINLDDDSDNTNIIENNNDDFTIEEMPLNLVSQLYDLYNKPVELVNPNSINELNDNLFAGGGDKNPYKVGTVDWYDWEDSNIRPRLDTIPFLKDLAVRLTNAGDFTGAVISPNVVDSLAYYGLKVGLPLREALGLTHESTMGNPTDTLLAYNMSSGIRRATNYTRYPTELHINNGKDVKSIELINAFTPYISNPYTAELDLVKKRLDNGIYTPEQAQQQLINDVPYVLRQASKYPYKDVPILLVGMEYYKNNPNNYNPGGYYTNGYQSWVQSKGDMLLGSPEILDILYDNLYNSNNEGQAFQTLYPTVTYDVPIGNIHINEDGSITTINTNPAVTKGSILLPDVNVVGHGPMWANNLSQTLLNNSSAKALGGNLFNNGGYTWKPVTLNGKTAYARVDSNGNYIDDLNDLGYTWHTLYSKPDINSTYTRGLTDLEYNNLTLAINSRRNDELLALLNVQTAFADAYANATSPTVADFYDLGPGLFFTNPFRLSQLVSEGDYKGAALNAGQTLFLSPVNTVEHGAMTGYGLYGLANENGIPKTVGLFSNGDYGRGLVSAGGDVLNGAMAFTGLRGLPTDFNTALYNRGYSIGLPTMEGRYFRIVGGPKAQAGDAIADANNTGVIRSNAFADYDNAPLNENTITLRPKSFDYTMWAKDRPWTGSTNGGNAGAKLGLGVGENSRIISTKADTGATVWEESNKDFRHKGHAGIFRPRYNDDLLSFPTLYAEWWDRMGNKPWNKWIWQRHLFEQPTFKSELDWSPESWFSTRSDGIYTDADIGSLLSHIPEYLEIERLSKLNGTWLKMPDGSTWEGDPRSWVLMLSRNYNEYTKGSPFSKIPFAHTSDKLFQTFDINHFGETDDGWYGKGFYSHPAEYLNGKMTAREKYGDNTYLLTTNVLRPLYLNDPNWNWAGLFNRENTNAPVGIFDNYDSVYFGMPNTTMNGAFPTELVVPNPTNYKSLLGNNGDFNKFNQNMYKSIIPIGLTTSALLYLKL